MTRTLPSVRLLLRAVSSFIRFFNRSQDVVGENLGNDAWQSQPCSHLNTPGVIAVNGVLGQADVGNAVNYTDFADTICENRFRFGTYDFPLVIANEHVSTVNVVHNNSPEFLESVERFGAHQNLAQNRWFAQ